MNLTPNDLKKGVIFFLDGEIYESLDYKQKIQGRQQSSVTVKARNLKNNKSLTYTFRGGENLTSADLSKKTIQFLYQSGGVFYFMDAQDFTQYEFKSEILGDKTAYLAEGQKAVLFLLEGQPLTIELPRHVWLEVESAQSVVRGDTSTAVTKDVRLSTGLIVKAPAFIGAGDIISVDTSNGTYRERQK